MDAAKKTDWRAYYELRSNPVTKYSKSVIKRSFLVPLKKYWPTNSVVKVAELGGSHSFFHPCIEARFSPAEYHIVDSHLSSHRGAAGGGKIRFHHKDILHLEKGDLEVDVVLSSGLIEHFGGGTEKAIESHFTILKPGGILVMSFPVPTVSYKMIRWFMEKTGVWIFHDEIPLAVDAVRPMISRYGTVLETRLLRALPLTQALVVARKTV